MKRMFKKKPKFEIVISNTRPRYGERVEFLNSYLAMNGSEEKLKEIMAEAFMQAHPAWKIKKITVTKLT